METEYNKIPEFLTSVHYALSGPITLEDDFDWVDIDGEDLDNFAQKGTVLGRVTNTGRYGPYDAGAGDGREIAGGILWEDVSFLKPNKTGVMLVHGWVDRNRLIGIDAHSPGHLEIVGIRFPVVTQKPTGVWSIFRITVVDSYGEPIEGAVFTYELDDGRVLDFTTDEDGRADILGPEGTYDFTLEHDYYDTVSGEFTFGYDGVIEGEIEMGGGE